jgi:pimeloyl-ACP methyl ester carboxylesterase
VQVHPLTVSNVRSLEQAGEFDAVGASGVSNVVMLPYDEFSMFSENAEEFGLPYDGPPIVRREFTALGDGRRLSSLVWGEGAPELVFLHGGAQNAHTWDTVAIALGRPLVAIDLPGHGHSDSGREGSLGLRHNAEDVAAVIRVLAPDAAAVIGMSLGGITTLALVDAHPELVRSVVLVDITPGVTAAKAAAITAFVQGPESFASFDDILARTIEHNPTRTVSSLRRGILHNAVQREDGSWVWRYARHRSLERPAGGEAQDYAALWDVVARIDVPLMLVRGMLPQSVVDDDDEAELLRRLPSARVEHVADAGHSVQGDAPVELARLIDDFTPPGPGQRRQ